jgi:hypothetical protein
VLGEAGVDVDRPADVVARVVVGGLEVQDVDDSGDAVVVVRGARSWAPVAPVLEVAVSEPAEGHLVRG